MAVYCRSHLNDVIIWSVSIREAYTKTESLHYTQISHTETCLASNRNLIKTPTSAKCRIEYLQIKMKYSIPYSDGTKEELN